LFTNTYLQMSVNDRPWQRNSCRRAFFSPFKQGDNLNMQ